MSITYSISAEQRLIKAYASGIIGVEDLHTLLDAILVDPALRGGLRGLYDARFAEPDITILQLSEIASKVARVVARGVERIAIVGESPNTIRVSKTFAVLARAIGIDVEVFDTLDEAEAWLDTPTDRISRSGETLSP
ncbi:MAG TPA: STAS/SEC14 domain-containing protein [Gemmatimonadaceae bacterium]|nr:STAS/SEC14 domain-containing protein [Gemmatimonadaceae bacterium]